MAALPAALVAYNHFSGGAWWVGHGTLNVEFVVTDSQSGRPITDASLEILELDRPPNMTGNYLFTLKTNEHGTVSKTMSGMTWGTDFDSPFRTDTYAIDIPPWRVRTYADGYDDLDLQYIGRDGEQRRRTEYLGGSRNRLIVPIQLTRIPTP
jgi:hypothetical protein